MKPKRAMLTLFAALVLASPLSPCAAQCNPSCQGDLNSDEQVTIDELVAAVRNALGGCEGSAERQGCLASGGTVSTKSCCASAPEFPDTCHLGACGCAPASSREVAFCECGDGTCFDRDQRACVP